MPTTARFLLVALVAGCLSPSDEAPGEPPAPDAPATFEASTSCRFSCFEPTIAVAPDGSVYVTAGSDAVWRGDPAGDAYLWTNVTPPDGAGLPADRIVDVAPRGRVFVSELSVGPTGAASAVRLVGSDDRGLTWTVQHSFGNGALGLSLDRQWVAAGPEGLVLVVYKNQAEGLYVHWSQDGGDTFDEGTLVALQAGSPGGIGPASAYASIVAGAPAFEGPRALIPLFHRFATTAGVGAGGLSVVAVEPGRPPVESPLLVDGTQPAGDFFPRLLWVGQALWLAWKDHAGGLHIATGVPTLLAEVPAPPHGTLTASPWMAAGLEGEVHVAWTQGDGAEAVLMHGVLEGGSWNVTVVGPTPGSRERPGHTDFAHFAMDGQRALVPLARPDGAGIVIVPVPE